MRRAQIVNAQVGLYLETLLFVGLIYSLAKPNYETPFKRINVQKLLEQLLTLSETQSILKNIYAINSFEIRLGVGSRFLTKLILTSIDSTKASFGPMTLNSTSGIVIFRISSCGITATKHLSLFFKNKMRIMGLHLTA